MSTHLNRLVPYARSRSTASTLATVTATALLTLWAATRPATYLDPYQRVPLVCLAPLLAASAIGASLHACAPELDGTAARPWWPLRLAHLLTLTAVAAALLAIAVPGHGQEYGAAAMIRNTLGATGITAGAAVLLGARLSWLPTVTYFGAVYASYAAPYLRTATLWTWSMQPGPQTASWVVAVTAFVVGTGFYAARGARS
ncbi:hypothetical protein [Streptomyces sp. BH105]|uniref:hypothetical protein n=1 Tax=Streptomyces sp. BH105 TaxID=3410408 RepID=UPI003CE7B283